MSVHQQIWKARGTLLFNQQWISHGIENKSYLCPHICKWHIQFLQISQLNTYINTSIKHIFYYLRVSNKNSAQTFRAERVEGIQGYVLLKNYHYYKLCLFCSPLMHQYFSIYFKKLWLIVCTLKKSMKSISTILAKLKHISPIFKL